MRIKLTFGVIVAAALLSTSGLAQDQSATTNLFRLSFRATCRSLNSSGRLVTTSLTDRDIIANAFGANLVTGRTNSRNFALAYNADADSIQAINLQTGDSVDIIHFGGGLATTDGRSTERFALMFFPGQVDQNGLETNVFGSAVITERTGRSSRANSANITGRVQFALNSSTVLGGAGTAASTTTTNNTPGQGAVMTSSNIPFDNTASICTGTFTTSRRLLFSVATTTTTTPAVSVSTPAASASVGATSGTAGASASAASTTGVISSTGARGSSAISGGGTGAITGTPGNIAGSTSSSGHPITTSTLRPF